MGYRSGAIYTNATAAHGNPSFSYTILAGSNRLIVVDIHSFSGLDDGTGSDTNVTGVTIGGQALTQRYQFSYGDVGGASKLRASRWYIKEANLPANGAQTVVVTYVNNGSGIDQSAIALRQYDDIEQATTFRSAAVVSDADLDTGRSEAIATQAGDIAIDAVFIFNEADLAVGAGQTERDAAEQTGTNIDVFTSDEVATGVSTTMSSSWSTNQDCAIGVDALIPAAPAGVEGAAAVSLPLLQIDAEATVDIAATAAAALPTLQLSTAGTVDVDGAAAVTLPKLQLSTTTTVDLTGSASITLPLLSASGAVALGQLQQGGRGLMIVLPPPERRARTRARKHGAVIQLVGYQAVVEGEATASVTLPNLAVSGQASVAITGTAAIALPLLQAFGSEEAVVAGSAAATLPRLQVSGLAAVGVAATSAASLPRITISAIAALEVGAVGAITLPLLQAIAAGQQGVVNDQQLVAHHHAGPRYQGRRI